MKTPLEKAKACCGKLHDKGTNRLLAAIAAAPEKPSDLGTRLFAEFEASVNKIAAGVIADKCYSLATNISIALIDAYGRGALDAHAVRDALDRKYSDLPRINWEDPEEPERFCECTGGFGLETDRDRHDDDDAQRAAQERADSAELPDDES